MATPLTKKLGMKPGHRVLTVKAPSNYRTLLGELPAGAALTQRVTGQFDMIHLFAESRAGLGHELKRLRPFMKRDGMIWVSWKKDGATEVTENMVRDLALSIGLVDVKICAVDDEWSGLKLMYRREDR